MVSLKTSSQIKFILLFVKNMTMGPAHYDQDDDRIKLFTIIFVSWML